VELFSWYTGTGKVPVHQVASHMTHVVMVKRNKDNGT